MLSRSQRISVEQFNTVMEKGKITHSPLFVARILGSQTDTRIAAVAPQKIFKRAVDRNKVRRKIYSAIRTVQGGVTPKTLVKGVHILLLAKLNVLNSTNREIETNLKTLFVKAGIMR